jgi:glucoamylase
MPEQIWDGPDLLSSYLRSGGTTDAAMPLLWAHSEYVKLHRPAADGRVFDLVEPAYDRYVRGNGERQAIRSGNRIVKCNQCMRARPSAYKRTLRFCCTGPATTGNTGLIPRREALPLASSSWTFACTKSKKVQLDSLSFGSN